MAIDIGVVSGTALKKLLKKQTIKQATTILNIVLMFLCVFLLAFFIWKIIDVFAMSNKMKVTLEKSIDPNMEGEEISLDINKMANSSFSDIADKTLFVIGSDGEKEAKKEKSTLDLALVGTFISPGNSFAIIEDGKKKEQESFSIGEVIFSPTNGKLVAITPDRVEINRDGKIEILEIERIPGIDSGEGDVMILSAKEVEAATSNVSLLVTQIRAVPYFKDNRSIGLRLFAIKPGSIFEKIGLQNGDILKNINGNDMGDITQAMDIFKQLKTEKKLAVTLERNSAEQKLSYEIK